ncbi:MAG: hypothetical protein IJN75_04330 [Clostridia bacterium]|nr:hypothetical protein [Clostridia bacterium]
MKCPKCNSENIKLQAEEVKPKLTGPLCLLFSGIATIVLGFVGTIIGAIIGLIIGLILSSLLPSGRQSIVVCQNCGYVSQPINNQNLGTKIHPLFCSQSESNLTIVRNDIVKGTIIVIRICVDGGLPFDISDNSTTYLKLADGSHVLTYEQINGFGKKKNKGQLNIDIDRVNEITISFSQQGLIVNQK